MSIVLIFSLLWCGAALYGRYRRLPAGISMEGKVHRVEAVEFLADLRCCRNGSLVHEQNIVPRLLSIIKNARQYLVLDIFLLTDRDNRQGLYPHISGLVVEALLDRKKSCPAMQITVITDEINTCYGATPSPLHAKLKSAGIQVILTDLTRLRDSNCAFSGLWRLLFQWFGTRGYGWLPSPFNAGAPRVPLRAYLKMMNFKANHRKVLASEREALVASANLDDAGAFHANIAFVVRGGILADILRAEKAVAEFSGGTLLLPVLPPAESAGDLELVYLTEGKIKKYLIEALQACGQGDAVCLGMFYLAEKDVVENLVAAAGRGSAVRIVLDPNKDAFGRKKGGMPNRQVAGQLVEKSHNGIKVRWYETHGEQFHAKLTCIFKREQAIIIGGSANLTRRNLGDFNLESCLAIRAPAGSAVARDVAGYFERIWHNAGGRFTVEVSAYPAGPFWKGLLVRFLERSGMCTF